MAHVGACTLVAVPGRSITRVELFGAFRVVRDGRVIAPGPTARQQQLLTYLILHSKDGAISRQRVAGALWPESTEPQARTNLRRELHHVREHWPELDRLIDANSGTLAWRGDDDVSAFERAVERGLAGDRVALAEAARTYKGDVLPDVAGDWIEVERTRLRQKVRAALLQLIDVLEREGALVDAIAHAEQLTRIDALCEDAWCALIRCHARRGERTTALHVYQECAALLKRELGVQPSAATRMAYREVLDLDVEPVVAPAVPGSTSYPLVGRDEEWRILLRAWRDAERGSARLVVLRGEAGIGKTRLAEELIEWCRAKNVSALTARSYASEGRLAYAPIATWLRSDVLQPVLATLDSATLTDVARLHAGVTTARDDVSAPVGQLESWQRLRFFDAVTRAFMAAAPLVMVLDDLQWADGDTIDWLQYFLQSGAAKRCLIVATLRAEEEDDNPAVGRLLRHAARDESLTLVPLRPLDREATAQLAGAVAEQALDDAALARTFRDTDGHPLFIIERGRMQLSTGADDVAANVLSRVQSVLAGRLALLSPEARAVAEVAAAIGRDFTFETVAHASDCDEASLARALDELWRRHILRVQPDARWDFTHDRIREVAYAGLGPARAPLVHRRIARAIELLAADRLDEVSALIAVHLDRGGQRARAVSFLQRAAIVATQVSANEEAVRCLNYALALLEHEPAGHDRDELEFALRSSLSVALNSARGYGDADVERNINRLLVLARARGDGEVPVPWLWVAFTMRYMLGDLASTLDVAQQALARAVSDPSYRCEAHHAMAGTLSSMGQLEASRQHFEAALGAYDESHPHRSEAMIHIAMTNLMARRLTSENTISWRDPTPQTKQQILG